MRFVDRQRTDLGRLRFLQVVAVTMCIVLCGAMLTRQLTLYDTYKTLDEKQCLRRILLPAARGCIYDRNGIVLAGNRLHFQLIARLEDLRGHFSARFKDFKKNFPKMDVHRLEEEALWAVLSEHVFPLLQAIGRKEMTVSPQKVLRHFHQELLMPLIVIDDLSDREYALLLEALPYHSPLDVFVQTVRDYPNGVMACHALGYVSQVPLANNLLPGDHLKTFFLSRQAGQTGLEYFYDEHLRGLNGGEIWRVDPSGKRYQRVLSVPSVNGCDLHTTLDYHLQCVCERAVEGKVGSIVVLDAQNGEVLAMASCPGFDLNALSPRISKKTFDQISAEGGWLNRATQGLYPPGSSFKIISSSAMLRRRVVHSDSYVDCHGSFAIGRRAFHCHYRRGHGRVNLTDALRVSCNVFTYQYALMCGPDAIGDEARRFHLHEPTGIDLPFETKHMIIPSPAWKKERVKDPWRPGDTANLSIGQGFVRVTPLQMACFVASFARNETTTRPTLTKRDRPIGESTVAMDPQYHSAIIRGMEESVESGSCRSMRIDGIRIAGKSGTAQVPVNGGTQMSHVAWLVGFAPIETPKIALAIAVEQTDLNETFWSSTKAVPIAKKIFEYALHPPPSRCAVDTQLGRPR
jgi:penicillin-binding protein 2